MTLHQTREQFTAAQLLILSIHRISLIYIYIENHRNWHVQRKQLKFNKLSQWTLDIGQMVSTNMMRNIEFEHSFILDVDRLKLLFSILLVRLSYMIYLSFARGWWYAWNYCISLSVPTDDGRLYFITILFCWDWNIKKISQTSLLPLSMYR